MGAGPAKVTLVMTGNLSLHVAIDEKDVVSGGFAEVDHSNASRPGGLALPAHHPDDPRGAKRRRCGWRIAKVFGKRDHLFSQLLDFGLCVPFETRQRHESRECEVELPLFQLS